MPATSNFKTVASVSPDNLMIPGQRERGPLTRFAATTEMVQTMVDVTMDAAGRADRQREGGGAPGERRRAARTSRFRKLLEAAGAWRVRRTPLEVAPATGRVL